VLVKVNNTRGLLKRIYQSLLLLAVLIVSTHFGNAIQCQGKDSAAAEVGSSSGKITPPLNEGGAGQNSDQSQVGSLNQVPDRSAADIATVLERLDAACRKVAQVLPTGKVAEIHENLKEVIRLQSEAGVGGLHEFSIALIKEALVRKVKKEIDAARYLLKKAIEISPQSSEVRFNAITLGSSLGEFSSLKAFMEALTLVPSDPSTGVKIIFHTLYPVAWSITIGVYVAFLIFCFFWIVDLLRQSALFFPFQYRGLAAPIFTGILLLLPIPLGPVVSVATWGLFLWILDRRRRWAIVSAAFVVLVWGFVSPIRERMGLWLERPGHKVLLSYSSGALGGADRYLLEQLSKESNAPGAALFAYGQLLRRYGDYSSSLKALDAAQRLLPGVSEVASERAVVYALLGNYDAARKDMESAESGGLRTAEHLYNFSRVAAEALDTAGSREYLLEASAVNDSVVQSLRAREDVLGTRHPSAYANVTLPLTVLLGSFWEDTFAPKEYKASILALGVSPFILVAVGLGLLLLVAIPVNTKSKRRLSPYYAGYQPSSVVLYLMRLLPGGPWAMRQNPLVACVLFAIGSFLSMPLIGWPMECRWLMELFPSWAPTYFTIIGVMTLALVIVGFIRSEEE
jgi:tetratricopeptide (TPR) repeat protein